MFLASVDTLSYAGIATHYIPSHRLPDLYERLSTLEESSGKVVSDVLDEFSEPGEPFSLDPVRKAIDVYAFLSRVCGGLSSSRQ